MSKGPPVLTSPEKLMYISCMIDVVNDKILMLCCLQNGGHNPEFTKSNFILLKFYEFQVTATN